MCVIFRANCSVHCDSSAHLAIVLTACQETCMCSPPHTHNWVHPLAAKSHVYFSLCYVYMQFNFHLLMFSQECNVLIVLPCRNFSWVLTSFLGTMFGDTAVNMLSLQKPGSRLLINSISHSHASDKHKVSLQQKRHGSLKPLRYPHISICFCKKILGRTLKVKFFTLSSIITLHLYIVLKKKKKSWQQSERRKRSIFTVKKCTWSSASCELHSRASTRCPALLLLCAYSDDETIFCLQ